MTTAARTRHEGTSADRSAELSIDDIVEQLAIAIQPRRKDRKRTRRGGRQALRALEAQNWPLAAQWLHAWYFHLLSDRKVKLSTVHRYASEVVDDVLVAGADIDFRAFDAIDFEHFYQRALDHSHRRKNIGYKASRFDDLHAFGVEKYDFARLPEPMNGQSNSSHVKAVVIPEPVFAAGREKVLSMSQYDETSRNCLWVLLTVLHRAGLRRGDALSLRIADLDPGGVFWIRVTDNEYSDTKRSKHRLPLTPLLLPAERDRVHAFLYDRLRSGDSKRALVFHPTGTPLQPWSGYDFSRLFASVIRCDATDAVHTPHDSRHTCCSQLQLVIEYGEEWVARLTPYSRTHAAEIRAALLHILESGRDNYWLLAAMASHSSPQMTLRNYLHYTNLMLYEGIRHIQAPLSLGQLKNLGGTTARRVSRWLTAADANEDLTTIDKLGQVLTAELAPFVAARAVTTGDAIATEPLPDLYQPFTRSTKDIDVAYRALTRYYDGTPIEVITKTLGISRETVTDWVDNCDYLATRRTRKRNAGLLRHISASRTRGSEMPHLPPRPRHHLDLKRLPKVLAAIQQRFESEPDEIRMVCALWLQRSTASNSGLPIDSPTTLARLLTVFHDAIPATHWRLQVRVPSTCPRATAVDEWNCVPGLELTVHAASPRQQSVSVWLYLRHPDEENMTTMTKIAIQREDDQIRLPKKFSSMLLRYVLFMSTVVLFSPNELRAMSGLEAGCDTREE